MWRIRPELCGCGGRAPEYCERCNDTGEATRPTKWDRRFMRLAREVASWSKDPSTKVGAVIVDEQRRVIGVGYNGFPRGVDDDSDRYADRPTKYAFVVHAEMNATLNCERRPEGATIYVWPLAPCQECAKAIIQAGVYRVVTLASQPERWGESTKNALSMFGEAGVEVSFLDSIEEPA